MSAIILLELLDFFLELLDLFIHLGQTPHECHLPEECALGLWRGADEGLVGLDAAGRARLCAEPYLVAYADVT